MFGKANQLRTHAKVTSIELESGWFLSLGLSWTLSALRGVTAAGRRGPASGNDDTKKRAEIDLAHAQNPARVEERRAVSRSCNVLLVYSLGFWSKERFDRGGEVCQGPS